MKKKATAPRNVWLWWCRECGCVKTLPCALHHFLESDTPYPIKYTRGNLYGTGKQPGRRRPRGLAK